MQQVKNDKYNMNCIYEERKKKPTRKYNRYMFFVRMLIENKYGRKLLEKMYPNRKIVDLETYLYYKKMYRINRSSKKEIRDIMNKIKFTLESND